MRTTVPAASSAGYASGVFQTVLRRLRLLLTPANVISAGFLLAVVALLWWLREATAFDPFTSDGMRALLDGASWRAPLIYVLIVAIAVVISQLPGVPLVIAAGAVFGIGPALAYSVLGNFLGAMIAYGLGHSLGRGVMHVLVGRVVVFRKERSVRAIGWLIFVSRTLPLFPFDLISYAAGVSAVPLRAYVPATLFGLVPSTLLLTVLGGRFDVGLAASLAISAVASVGLLVAAWAMRGRDPFGIGGSIDIERTPGGPAGAATEDAPNAAESATDAPRRSGPHVANPSRASRPATPTMPSEERP